MQANQSQIKTRKNLRSNPYDPVVYVAPDPAVGIVLVEQQGNRLLIRFKPAYIITGILGVGTILFSVMSGFALIKMQSINYSIAFALASIAEALGFLFDIWRFTRLILQPDKLIIEGRHLWRYKHTFDLCSLKLSIKNHRARGVEFHSLQLLDSNRVNPYNLQAHRRFHEYEAEYLIHTIESYQAKFKTSACF